MDCRQCIRISKFDLGKSGLIKHGHHNIAIIKEPDCIKIKNITQRRYISHKNLPNKPNGEPNHGIVVPIFVHIKCHAGMSNKSEGTAIKPCYVAIDPNYAKMRSSITVLFLLIMNNANEMDQSSESTINCIDFITNSRGELSRSIVVQISIFIWIDAIQ
jgi:hypothetical protein